MRLGTWYCYIPRARARKRKKRLRKKTTSKIQFSNKTRRWGRIEVAPNGALADLNSIAGDRIIDSKLLSSRKYNDQTYQDDEMIFNGDIGQ